MGECGHCDGEVRGFARAQGKDLCHPDSGLDCYRLVTVYGHELPCYACADVRVLEDEQRRGPLLTMGLSNMTVTEATRFADG